MSPFDLNDEKEIQINKVREKIKLIIKKNTAYLQQYLYRGTPKILPEEYRYKLANLLEINIDEITPNWLRQITNKDKLIIFKNIENPNDTNTDTISISEKLLTDIYNFDIKKLFFYQTKINNFKITTVVDTEVTSFIKHDLYLLNDNNTLFLAYVNESHLKNDKMIVKPFLNSFHPFHIPSKMLSITARVIWQSSEIML